MCTIMCAVGNIAEDAINALAQMQSHRGPDGYSMWHKDSVSIASQRLAIIDIENGNQPMADETGRIWISHSGEIYNFLELKEELKEMGNVFYTGSDTEVILRAYQEWGENCLDRFNGMFAFVLYDQNREKVFFARDRFGIKPLHYSITNNLFLISSEAKGILNQTNNRILNTYQGLDFYFNSGENTRFTSISQLPPGTWGVLDILKDSTFKFNTGQYYAIPENKKFRYCDIAQEKRLSNLLYEFLDKSVRKHLISDVPIGIFTSGGIDSGIITSIASKYRTQIQAFTVRVSNSKIYDEFNQAKKITDKLGMSLELVDITQKELIKALPTVIYHLEDYDPRTVELGILNYFLAKKAKEMGVHVVLTGEGSDEIFCGYRNFFPKTNQTNSISSAKLQQIRLKFLKGLAGNHLLHKDRACMAHSVEARLPFLDNDLVEFALNIDPNLLTRKGIDCDRYLLRLAAQIEVAAGRMPESTRLAPKGYAQLQLGVPYVICRHFNIDVKKSLESRYCLYKTIFEQVFVECRNQNELGEELFYSNYLCSRKRTFLIPKKYCDSVLFAEV